MAASEATVRLTYSIAAKMLPTCELTVREEEEEEEEAYSVQAEMLTN